MALAEDMSRHEHFLAATDLLAVATEATQSRARDRPPWKDDAKAVRGDLRPAGKSDLLAVVALGVTADKTVRNMLAPSHTTAQALQSEAQATVRAPSRRGAGTNTVVKDPP